MTSDTDVAVIGAGLAGASAAVVCARMGLRVTLVDPKPEYPLAFKAEKIEPDQADILRRLGLLDGMIPHVARIERIHEAHAGRVVNVRPIEQYGAPYQDLVNAVQRQLPATVNRRMGRLMHADLGSHGSRLTLDSGESITARLVVFAAGTGGTRLQKELGITHQVVRDLHSLCTGFDVVREDDLPFAFDSVTYYADRVSEGVGYVTFFRIPGAMRVNVFSYRAPKDAWVQAMRRDPAATLRPAMPGLTRVTGPWRASSLVTTRVIDLYTANPPGYPGIVLIGDAFQSVCPATGTGLSKVLTDVEVLCGTYLQCWLEGGAVTARETAEFYGDARKV
jgi:2-polyprenyl-6-methoxyphenol hydroxylase-like FAD-dependent oxidoreductase